ncbi:MAG: type VI secretion system tube protein TssD [Pseudomonadota bacterium]
MQSTRKILVLSTFMVFTSFQAFATDGVYLYVEGADQGHIKGDVTYSGQVDTIDVDGWSMEFNAVRNINGFPVRRQDHTPFAVTKAVDVSSVPLLQAFINKENLDVVELRIYQDSADGSRQHYFTIKLEDATISDMRQTESNTLFSAGIEEINLFYETITWTYEPTGASTSDDW